jgi:hypothetical protein
VNDPIAFGAAVLVITISFGALATRWLLAPEPTARHRARRTLLRPAEVTVRCRAEGRPTVHVRTRITGERICRSCGHINTATPEGHR